MQLQLITGALRRRPEFQVCACSLNSEEILQFLEESPVDVLLLSFPKTLKTLVLESTDRDLVVNAFPSRARGLFCFSVSQFRSRCKCIQVVHPGQIWATAQQIDFLIDLVSQLPSLRVVNVNAEVLVTPHEIAQELALSEHTVKKYLFRIFEKLGISTRVELVLYALNHGDHRPAEGLPGIS